MLMLFWLSHSVSSKKVVDVHVDMILVVRELVEKMRERRSLICQEGL